MPTSLVCLLQIVFDLLSNLPTEIAKREIPAILKQVKFTGGLRYNESKQLYRQVEPGIPDYGGTPTPSVTAAWHELVSSMYNKIQTHF